MEPGLGERVVDSVSSKYTKESLLTTRIGARGPARKSRDKVSSRCYYRRRTPRKTPLCRRVLIKDGMRWKDDISLGRPDFFLPCQSRKTSP